MIDNILKEIKDKDCITILDCACGKSYLSFVLNFYIKEVLKKNCYFIGIDYSDVVIEASKIWLKTWVIKYVIYKRGFD